MVIISWLFLKVSQECFLYSYFSTTNLPRVYATSIEAPTMAKTVKMSKMASNDDPHPTVSGSEESILVVGQP
jgi:hypothetical protein